MLKNYLITSFRSLYKNRVYTFLNITGLSLCFVAVFFIVQYVHFEKSFDDYHSKGDRIFRVGMELTSENSSSTSAGSYFGLGKVASEEFSQIEDYFTTSFNNATSGFFGYKQEDIEQNYRMDKVYYATSSVLNILDFTFVEGSAQSGLSGTSGITITRQVADRIFGDSEAVGQNLTWYNTSGSTIESRTYQVGAVVEDIPANAHFKFDVLLPMDAFLAEHPDYLSNIWIWYGYYNYVLLKSSEDRTSLENSYPEFMERQLATRARRNIKVDAFLEPVRDIHLNSTARYQMEEGGDEATIKILILISVFLVILAYTNYLNLITSVNLSRAKEVGIRKVLGSSACQITYQFLVETIIVSTIAFIISILVISMLKGFIPQWIDGFPVAYLFNDYSFWISATMVMLSASVLAGLYPAILVSQFKNIDVIKGIFGKNSKGNLLHKGMVLLQFTIASILIMFTLMVNKQLSYMFATDIGADVDQVVVARAPLVNEGSVLQAVDAFRNYTQNDPQIDGVSASTMIPGIPMWGNSASIPGRTGTNQILRRISVDEDYLDVYRHEFVAGRGFSRSFATDQTAAVVNEKTAEIFGYTPAEILNKKISLFQDTLRVIGVIEDYHHNSLKSEILPVIMTNISQDVYYVSIRLKTSDLPRTMSNLQTMWETNFAGSPFDYFFADEHFDRLYAKEQKLGKIVSAFSTTALIIASLGVFGLSLFSLLKRRKEIGIRKVLGAPGKHLFWFFSRDVFLLVLIAGLISTPMSYMLVSNWLDSFANRVSIDVIYLIAPIAITLGFALLTIGYNILKALSVNPVESLRNE